MFKKFFDNKEVFLFDLDGTIVDTEQFWMDALIKTLNENKIEVLGVFDVYGAGLSLREGWRQALEDFDVPNLEKDSDELTEETYKNFLNIIKEQEEIEAKEGFWSLLTELRLEKGFKAGLVTNTEQKIAEEVIKKADLSEVFDLYVFGDNVKKPKPDPEMYKLAAKEIKTNPKNILVFEDSVAGSIASVKAGMDTIVIWDGFIEKHKYPKKVLDFYPSFKGLAGNLDLTYKEAVEKAVEELEEEKNKKG